jgi:hypothetical protein
MPHLIEAVLERRCTQSASSPERANPQSITDQPPGRSRLPACCSNRGASSPHGYSAASHVEANGKDGFDDFPIAGVPVERGENGVDQLHSEGPPRDTWASA